MLYMDRDFNARFSEPSHPGSFRGARASGRPEPEGGADPLAAFLASLTNDPGNAFQEEENLGDVSHTFEQDESEEELLFDQPSDETKWWQLSHPETWMPLD